MAWTHEARSSWETFADGTSFDQQTLQGMRRQIDQWSRGIGSPSQTRNFQFSGFATRATAENGDVLDFEVD